MNKLIMKVFLGRKQAGIILKNDDGYFYRSSKLTKPEHDKKNDGCVFTALNRCMFSVAAGSSEVKFIDVEAK